MKRLRNRSCIYTGRVGAKMPLRKPTVSRRVVKRTVQLSGGPLDGARVRLDVHAGVSTFSLSAMKGFPPGRYINSTWTPDEALQDDVRDRGRLAEVF